MDHPVKQGILGVFEVFVDASTALPIFANILALWILAPRFVQLLNDYKARHMGIGKVDPGFKVFYTDQAKSGSAYPRSRDPIASA